MRTIPASLIVRWLPEWRHRVSGETLRADLIAGLLGALLVLPQGVAFATLAGLPPQYGIYTAVVPCIVAALFGSSWHVMSGPTNANSLALFAMLSPLALAGSPQYIQFVLAVTLLVGLLQLAIGALRLGMLANFISPSVLLGFTCGAATLIALYALKDLLGLELPAGTTAFGVVRHIWTDYANINLSALAVGVVTLGASLAARRWLPRTPHMLLGLIAGYGAAFLFNHINETGPLHHVAIVGPIPAAVPPFVVPTLSWNTLGDLLGIAAALTIVALGQAISIAKAVALRSGQHIEANREFIGQGLSNIAGSFFSSYVSCGSLNRSVPNYEAGAKTPLAAVFSSLLLVALVALSASLLAQIPLAAIAAMLLLVSWSLFDLERFRQIRRVSHTEFLIALGTFAATLVMRLEIAILLGTILSLVAYLYRTSRPAIRPMVPDQDDPHRRFTPLDELRRPQEECPQLKLVRVEGAIFFGAVAYVTDRLHDFRTEAPQQRHLLAMSKSMNFIDLAGAEMWDTECRERRAMGGDLYFHRPRSQVLETWQETGFTERLGEEHIFATKRQAIHAIYQRLDRDICASCTARVFDECREQQALQQRPSATEPNHGKPEDTGSEPAPRN